LLILAACAPALTRFEGTLAAHDSATAALQSWCSARGIAAPAEIRARLITEPPRAATPAIRTALGAAPQEPVAYRHVRLTCGKTVLSDAQNWYVPARLTPAMNAALETTDTPFGKITAPLGYRRERLAAQRGRAAECPHGTVLSHRALLRLADGHPISFVSECYTGANIQAAN
jgi:chorismate-pyruvate lyase